MGILMDQSGLHLDRAKLENMPEALHAGAEVILADAVDKAPKESNDLAESGRVDDDRGGDDTVAIIFDSVYARYQHEHLRFKHPHGGQAKFLEGAMLEKGNEALSAIAEVLRS